MRVLVLGGTGFLGPSIVLRLLAHGHTVSVFHRGETSAELPVEVHHVLGHRERLIDYRDEFKSLRPDVIVDVIAATGQQTQLLMNTFHGVAQRVLILSSGDAYFAYDVFSRKAPGPIQSTPIRETGPLRTKLYPYRGVSLPPIAWMDSENYEKIDVERLALADPQLPATILRLPMIYGPGDYDGLKRRFFPYLKRMDDGRKFILLNEAHAQWRWPLGYSGNIAEAVALAVSSDRAAGEIYNVADPDPLTTRDWIEELAYVTGWSGKIVTTPHSCPPPDISSQFNLNQHLDMDSTKIREQLGFREVTCRQEALEHTVGWDRNHPPRQIDPAQFDYAAEDGLLAGQ